MENELGLTFLSTTILGMHAKHCSFDVHSSDLSGHALTFTQLNELSHSEW
jgi:hypothetical protein